MRSENAASWPELPPGRSLAGRVALVTGSGSDGPLPGTGVAIACMLAAQGATLAIVDVDGPRAETTLARIAARGGQAQAFTGDITSSSTCGRLISDVAASLGRLDILVNNAAIPGGREERADPERVWHEVLALNLTACRHMIVHAAPLLAASPAGSIINVASIAATRAMSSPAYAASKGGLLALTRSFALTLGRDGIRVNCITAGHIHAPMSHTDNTELRALRARATMLATEGTAWDVASAALFLASDESRWITGTVLPVDGGSSAAAPLSLYRSMHGSG